MANMKLDIAKDMAELRFLTIMKNDGSARMVLNIPNVRQFERSLTEAEVAHARFQLHSLSEGALKFDEEVEPGDVLGEAIANTGLIEDQAAMILSLTSERDTAARAAANANQQFDETSRELEAVRKRLREVSDSAVEEMASVRGETAAAETKLATAVADNNAVAKERDEALKSNEALVAQLKACAEDLVKLEQEKASLSARLAGAEKLLNEKTAPTPATA